MIPFLAYFKKKKYKENVLLFFLLSKKTHCFYLYCSFFLSPQRHIIICSWYIYSAFHLFSLFSFKGRISKFSSAALTIPLRSRLLFLIDCLTCPSALAQNMPTYVNFTTKINQADNLSLIFYSSLFLTLTSLQFPRFFAPLP